MSAHPFQPALSWAINHDDPRGQGTALANLFRRHRFEVKLPQVQPVDVRGVAMFARLVAPRTDHAYHEVTVTIPFRRYGTVRTEPLPTPHTVDKAGAMLVLWQGERQQEAWGLHPISACELAWRLEAPLGFRQLPELAQTAYRLRWSSSGGDISRCIDQLDRRLAQPATDTALCTELERAREHALLALNVVCIQAAIEDQIASQRRALTHLLRAR